MKSALFGLFFSLFFIDNTKEQNVPNVAKEIMSCGPEATCYGNNPCNACKTCNYCKHCNSGGSCGICSPGKKKVVVTSKKTKQVVSKQSLVSSQCRATTKKGSRCSRSASSGGYCWQHG